MSLDNPLIGVTQLDGGGFPSFFSNLSRVGFFCLVFSGNIVLVVRARLTRAQAAHESRVRLLAFC